MEEHHSCMRPARMATARLQSPKITAGDQLEEFEVLIEVSCWFFPFLILQKFAFNVSLYAVLLNINIYKN